MKITLKNKFYDASVINQISGILETAFPLQESISMLASDVGKLFVECGVRKSFVIGLFVCLDQTFWLPPEIFLFKLCKNDPLQDITIFRIVEDKTRHRIKILKYSINVKIEYLYTFRYILLCMKAKSKIAKMGDRKIIEVPASVRDFFPFGEKVVIYLDKVSPQKAQWAREILEEIKKKEAEAP